MPEGLGHRAHPVFRAQLPELATDNALRYPGLLDLRSASAPEQRRSSRCSAAPLPLIHCSPARAGVAQVPGRWQGVSGADVDLLIVPLSASARVTAGVGGVTWRSGRLTQG